MSKRKLVICAIRVPRKERLVQKKKRNISWNIPKFHERQTYRFKKLKVTPNGKKKIEEIPSQTYYNQAAVNHIQVKISKADRKNHCISE